ncbi:MAG: PH domain-containing protein [Alistipes sp.]|nr:PH domain-containing protein [Alistipes sp.]
MQSVYKYRFDRRTIYWTLVYVAVFGLLGGGLYRLYEGGYLSAWFTSFIMALIALMALSVPRKIVVTDQTLQVRCLLDITEIDRSKIVSARSVEPREMKWIVPLFGACGFFGYYGHYYDLRSFTRVKLYATEWRNFVEIVTVYEDRLYVSCREAAKLAEELTASQEVSPADSQEA